MYLYKYNNLDNLHIIGAQLNQSNKNPITII